MICDQRDGQEAMVAEVSVADAKARLTAFVDRAQAGETVCITQRGKPVARITPIETPRQPIDIEALRRHVSTMPYQEESAGDFVRRMRDEGRY